MLLIDNPLWSFIDLHLYEPFVSIFDGIIVLFFLVDLTFKWLHVKDALRFVKLYWLDLIAVMPFYLIFRVYSRTLAFVLTAEELAAAQQLAHEAVLVREAEMLKEAKVIAREEQLLKEAKPLIRWIRSISRMFRVGSRYPDTKKAMKHVILDKDHH